MVLQVCVHGKPFGSEFEPLDFSSYVLVSFHSPHMRTKLCCDSKLSAGSDVSVSGFLCCPCVQRRTLPLASTIVSKE